MISSPLDIPGVFVIEPERFEDQRGFFFRTWCKEEMAHLGLATRFAQCSASVNSQRGVLRGMHYQSHPHQEAKLIRCVRGAIFDVALDLRPESPTFCRWAAVELNCCNGLQLYVPEGCAHGFQALEDDTEVQYQITAPYAALSARGVRWDDPAFGINWPIKKPILSDRDARYPDFHLEAIAA